MLPLGIICAYVNRKGEPTHLPIFKGTYLVELQSITYSSQIFANLYPLVRVLWWQDLYRYTTTPIMVIIVINTETQGSWHINFAPGFLGMSMTVRVCACVKFIRAASAAFALYIDIAAMSPVIFLCLIAYTI